MASVNSWIAHFKDMSENRLVPGTLQYVRNKGGAGRVYYKVQQPIISPVEQVVKQARARVPKSINNGKRKRPATVKRPRKTSKQPKRNNKVSKKVAKKATKPKRQVRKKSPRDILS